MKAWGYPLAAELAPFKTLKLFQLKPAYPAGIRACGEANGVEGKSSKVIVWAMQKQVVAP